MGAGQKRRANLEKGFWASGFGVGLKLTYRRHGIWATSQGVHGGLVGHGGL